MLDHSVHPPPPPSPFCFFGGELNLLPSYQMLVFREMLRTYFMDDPKINFLHQPSRSMNKAWKLVLKKIDWNLNITLS